MSFGRWETQTLERRSFAADGFVQAPDCRAVARTAISLQAWCEASPPGADPTDAVDRSLARSHGYVAQAPGVFGR
jgi:hypothetical protein